MTGQRVVFLGLAAGVIVILVVLGSLVVNYTNTIGDLRTQVATDDNAIQSLLLQRYLILNSSNFSYSDYSFLNSPSDCDGGGVCFGAGPSNTIVFNCAAAAVSASGCTQLVANANGQGWKYYVNVRYPILLQGTQSLGLDCTFTTVADNRSYGFSCIPINATAFVVGIANGPPV